MCKCMFKILTYSSCSASINLSEVSSYVDIVKMNVSAKLTNISKCSTKRKILIKKKKEKKRRKMPRFSDHLREHAIGLLQGGMRLQM